MINNQQRIQSAPQLAPGQGRQAIQYLRPPGGGMSPYPVPQQSQQPPQMMDPRMMAFKRRLALTSQTGDISPQERSISGRDSMGRPQPDKFLMKDVK